MRFRAETLTLDETVFVLLRDAIHDQTGLFFDMEKRELLADKLSPLLIEMGFRSFLDYYYLLKYDANAEREWGRIIDTLSVQESYFWREMDQVNALVDTILPEYFATHRFERLRIWSAACAKGEEPISIAIALNEAGWFERARIDIHGTDASTSAIARARQATYGERSFRALPAHLRQKYFIETEKGSVIKPEIHSRIKWSNLNLHNERQVSALAGVPMVFCRNVFIYFSEGSIRKTARLLYDNMPSPAYLFIGVSESLLRVGTGFELKEIDGAFVYIKG